MFDRQNYLDTVNINNKEYILLPLQSLLLLKKCYLLINLK